MLSGNKIFVPTYQRAYSWEDKQTKQFLVDLQDYVESHTASSYYFGHFLFEDKGSRNFAIIDGQQRLTTITIFTEDWKSWQVLCQRMTFFFMVPL